jgi:signal transduction histidine kinase
VEPDTVELESVGMAGAERLPREVETTIYRVVQEALTNILKHAVPTPTEEQGG